MRVVCNVYKPVCRAAYCGNKQPSSQGLGLSRKAYLPMLMLDLLCDCATRTAITAQYAEQQRPIGSNQQEEVVLIKGPNMLLVTCVFCCVRYIMTTAQCAEQQCPIGSNQQEFFLFEGAK